LTLIPNASEVTKIFNGSSPFGDGGDLEAIDGIPQGAPIPNLPDAPQEFASGLDGELKKLTQQIQTSASSGTASKKKRI
jgi:Mn-containing catalase